MKDNKTSLKSNTTILTGTHINYYHVCTRKLWLFHYGVTMEHKSDLVVLGRLVHKESYDRRPQGNSCALIFLLLNYIENVN